MEMTEEKFFEEVYSLLSEETKKRLRIEEETNRQFYKAASNWMQGPIMSHINKYKIKLEEIPVKKEFLYYIISLVEFTNLISFSSAVNKVFPKMLENPDKHPWDIISENNWFEDQGEDETESVVDDVISKNPQEFERLKAGEQKLFGFFIGIIRKQSGGKADASLIKEILTKKIA